ncbi:MAG: hypothetical protein Q8S84_00395 [bacterium]|nr:hypothetical protein [bacterium]
MYLFLYSLNIFSIKFFLSKSENGLYSFIIQLLHNIIKVKSLFDILSVIIF